MQVAIRRVLPTARQRLSRPQRFGPRTPTYVRTYPRSRCFSQHAYRLQQTGSGPRPAADSVDIPEGKNAASTMADENTTAETQSVVEGEPEARTGDAAGETVTGAGNDANGESPARRGRPPGSRTRRVTNGKAASDIPQPELPDWYVQRSVLLREENDAASSEVLIVDSSEGEQSPEMEAAKEPLPALGAESPPKGAKEPAASETGSLLETTKGPTVPEAANYQIHELVWAEIRSHIKTGLILPKGPYAESMTAVKSHCILHLPKDGGTYYLDALVQRLAAEVEADVIRIDSQDLAELAGDFLGDSVVVSQSRMSPTAIRALGYDTQLQSMERPNSPEEETAEETAEQGEEEEGDDDNTASNPQTPPAVIEITNQIPEQVLKLLRGRILGSVASIIPLTGANGNSLPPAVAKTIAADQLNEQKMERFLKAMTSANHQKRALKHGLPWTPDSSGAAQLSLATNCKTLVHVRDYRELESTVSGQAVLRMLQFIIQDRRREGERIMILGTTSSEEPLSAYSKTGVKNLQYQSEESYERAIVVPPVFDYSLTSRLERDYVARIREINIRHIRDAIRRRSGTEGEEVSLSVPDDWCYSDENDIPEISDKVWNFDRVHRVVTVALGRRKGAARVLSISHIAAAVDLIDRSDNVKYDWAERELQYLKERDETVEGEGKSGAATKRKRPKNCNHHEKKLLSGIIDPEDIKTRFSSIRAPPETIESMKMLTSLSLIRPEAFKYGVLATDRIPGVLLYGPPGTGKTLLAKAVAKESGATVLEVSGADIADMYVGESEKNVKAVFSLAKKLSPCVIFIDEADAIFGTRQTGASRTSHRETINQFLREWADMTGTAFIMVATNRPFDLDDAVLRRLPRRILIDLPTKEDRLEILKIHLKEETLHPSVNLRNIAERTTLYSGSDLKNICVSAALSCVREENAEFEKTKKYPERRTLRPEHFEKALSEISASINDDMGSLVQIRKFDDKYGERAGKRKRVKGLGFELGQSSGSAQGEARVRMD